MNLLLVGRMDGWMGVYLRQLARAFGRAGADCRTFSYRESLWDRSKGVLLRRDHGSKKAARTRRLLRAIRSHDPGIVVITGKEIDFELLRSGTRATLAHWDFDGPAVDLGERRDQWEGFLDVVFTVSRRIERSLADGPTPVHYLPHGVDLDDYAPGEPAAAARARFAADASFVGRPGPHRVELLSTIADLGLVVWGRRWSAREWRRPPLSGCIREPDDVGPAELVDLYRASGAVVNVLRDPFTAGAPSVMNLQVFAVPASGGCLITEWVEELEEAFVPERELLPFRSAQELREQVRFCRDHPEQRARIAAAGRRRCERDHSLLQRAQRILDLAARSTPAAAT